MSVEVLFSPPTLTRSLGCAMAQQTCRRNHADDQHTTDKPPDPRVDPTGGSTNRGDSEGDDDWSILRDLSSGRWILRGCKGTRGSGFSGG